MIQKHMKLSFERKEKENFINWWSTYMQNLQDTEKFNYHLRYVCCRSHMLYTEVAYDPAISLL